MIKFKVTFLNHDDKVVDFSTDDVSLVDDMLKVSKAIVVNAFQNGRKFYSLRLRR